jgi:hypothetical protein
MLKTRLLLVLTALAFATLACAAAERLLFGNPQGNPQDGSETSWPEPAQPETASDPQPAPAQQSGSPAGSDCPRGDCVVACMKQLDSVLAPSSANALRSKFHNQSIEEVVLVTYQVENGQIVRPEVNPDVPAALRKLQENTQAHQNLWRYYAALIPAAERDYLNQFIIYTDGKEEGLAAVSQSTSDPARWDLMVDINDAEPPQDLTFTLIHEFGHLLTLNASQVEPNLQVFNNPDDPDIFYNESLSCPSYFTYEGCANPESYINLFIEQFWSDLFAEWAEIDAEEDEDRYYERLDQFYNQYADQFITDYAATSPEEDIAESFSYFILTSAPQGDSIAEQKVLFFYQFPELVKLREQIALGLCSQTR